MDLYSGQIAVVDLTDREVQILQLDEEAVTDSLGGTALNIRFYEEYAAEDPVVIGTGLLTGTLVPGSALAVITAKGSDGQLVNLPMVHFLGAEIKYAGFDFLIIKGKAPQPVYLWVHDGVINLEDAGVIWGKDAWETTDWLKKEKGDDIVQVMAIGPAAEKGVPGAQSVNNYWNSPDHFGIGALLGDKKLKAIAWRGLGILDAQEIDKMVESSIVCQEKMVAQKTVRGVADRLKNKELADWLSPLVHRHKGCFSCVQACATFVKYNESPAEMRSTAVREPGFLITDGEALFELYQAGLTIEDAGRLLEKCAREGVDPVTVARAVKKSGKNNLAGAIEVLSASLPPSGAGTKQNHEEDILISYLLGICPVLMTTAKNVLTRETLLDLIKLGTGMEVTVEKLQSVLGKLRGVIPQEVF